MTNEQLQKLKAEFDSLDGFKQWEWLVKNKAYVQMVTLDNDTTSISLVGDEESDYLLYAEDDCGDRSGTTHLLTLLKLPNEFC